jgi:hypothetical protein
MQNGDDFDALGSYKPQRHGDSEKKYVPLCLCGP